VAVHDTTPPHRQDAVRQDRPGPCRYAEWTAPVPRSKRTPDGGGFLRECSAPRRIGRSLKPADTCKSPREAPPARARVVFPLILYPDEVSVYPRRDGRSSDGVWRSARAGLPESSALNEGSLRYVPSFESGVALERNGPERRRVGSVNVPDNLPAINRNPVGRRLPQPAVANLFPPGRRIESGHARRMLLRFALLILFDELDHVRLPGAAGRRSLVDDLVDQLTKPLTASEILSLHINSPAGQQERGCAACTRPRTDRRPRR